MYLDSIRKRSRTETEIPRKKGRQLNRPPQIQTVQCMSKEVDDIAQVISPCIQTMGMWQGEVQMKRTPVKCLHAPGLDAGGDDSLK